MTRKSQILSDCRCRFLFGLLAWALVVGCQPALWEPPVEPLLSQTEYALKGTCVYEKGATWIVSNGLAIDFERLPEEMFGFGIKAYLGSQAPHLGPYAEIISHVAARKKLSARLLMALMEQQSGALSNDRFNRDTPLGDLSAQLGFLEQVRDVCHRLRAFARPGGSQDTQRTPQEALSSLLSIDEINQLGRIYQRLFPGVTSSCHVFGNDRARQQPVLQFPYPIGESWEYGGTHADDGSGSIYNSLDFADGWPDFGTPVNVYVVASAAGKVYVGSSCYLDIDHGNGWLTSYYHMDHIMVETGDMVQVNQPIGKYADNHAQAICMGGGSSAEHVHWGLWLDNKAYALDDVVLSGWTVHPGQSNYDDNCNRFYLHRDGKKICAWTSLENEGASCTENDTQPISCGVGVCSGCAGEETCTSGEWVVSTPCDPMCDATQETCNDLDDDCDGTADEGLDAPTTCGVGACASCTGVIPCEGGPDTCDPLCKASIELCGNAIDDDCDGTADEAECVVALENLILPSNGGVLESFTSEYGEGWVASDLTNEVTDEDGWASVENPSSPQEFVYSFLDGKNAFLAEAVIHGGTAEGQYFSKDVEVWTSLDGNDYTLVASGRLSNSNNDVITLYLKNTQAKQVKLVITSGYKSDYWELGEFVVKGSLDAIQTNSPPIAKDQNVNTSINAAKDLVLSASDSDNDDLTFSIVAAPTHGTLSGTVPNIRYTPDKDYTGADKFTFQANDGQADSNLATVSITVQPAANQAPLAHALSVTTAQGSAKQVTLSASDPDGDSLTYRVATGPAHGTLSGNAPKLTYTPDAGYTGADEFTFQANDGQADSNVATVTITVKSTANVAPVAHSSSVSATQGTAKAITLSANDVDGDSLTYRIVTNPVHGTLSGAAPNLTYTPDADYLGTDSFRFQAHDGTADSNVAMVSIEVVSDDGTIDLGSLFGCSQSAGSQVLFVPLMMLGLIGLCARRKRSACPGQL